MPVAEIEVINELGLHARAAAQVEKLAGQFECEITISRVNRESDSVVAGETIVDAKSILSILLLAASKGTKLRVEAVGRDSEAALFAIGELFANRFGETSEKEI